MFAIIEFISILAHYYTLDGIKSKTVGDGQYGTARFATAQEIKRTYKKVIYEPERWRRGEHLPDVQGLVVGYQKKKGTVTALIDDGGIHCLRIPWTHPLYRKKRIKMEDLSCQRYAMYSTQFHIRHNFVTTCKNAGFEPAIDISSSDFNSLREISLQNNLLFVVPAHTIRLDDSKFRHCKFPDNNFTWDVYYVTKKNKILTENMLAFYRYIKVQLPLL